MTSSEGARCRRARREICSGLVLDGDEGDWSSREVVGGPSEEDYRGVERVAACATRTEGDGVFGAGGGNIGSSTSTGVCVQNGGVSGQTKPQIRNNQLLERGERSPTARG